jgi:hypothetical protein
MIFAFLFPGLDAKLSLIQWPIRWRPWRRKALPIRCHSNRRSSDHWWGGATLDLVPAHNALWGRMVSTSPTASSKGVPYSSVATARI